MLGMFAERMCRVGIMVDNVFHEKGKIKTSYLKLYNHGFSFLFILTLKITAAAAAKSRQLCLTLCDPIDSSPPGSRPWDSPGKNTGVGCHFLLQCVKVKSESEVAQLCPTLSDHLDCSLPASSIHGISQARVLEWGAIAFFLKIAKAG